MSFFLQKSVNKKCNVSELIMKLLTGLLSLAWLGKIMWAKSNELSFPYGSPASNWAIIWVKAVERFPFLVWLSDNVKKSGQLQCQHIGCYVLPSFKLSDNKSKTTNRSPALAWLSNNARQLDSSHFNISRMWGNKMSSAFPYVSPASNWAIIWDDQDSFPQINTEWCLLTASASAVGGGYTLRRNSSPNCIFSSKWALSCRYTAELLAYMVIYSGVSGFFWECR